eukprot:1322111-Amorphochlora_amoeboformis.AAC.1
MKTRELTLSPLSLLTHTHLSFFRLSTLQYQRIGIQMPIFGLGTWLAKGKGECLQACQWAINAGYR